MQEPTDVDEKALRRYAKAVEDAAERVERIQNRAKKRDAVPSESFGKLPESSKLKTAYDTQSSEAESDLKDVATALHGISKGIKATAFAYDQTEGEHTRLFGGGER